MGGRIKTRMRNHLIPSHSNERGDTLIEVLLAVAILSLATVMTMTVVNNSHRQILSEINRETVRSEVSSQSELIQYFHDISAKLSSGSNNKWAAGQEPEEVQLWNAIKAQALDSNHLTNTQSIDAVTGTCSRGSAETGPGAAFYLARGTVADDVTARSVLEGSFTNDNSNPNAKYYIVTKPGTDSLRINNHWSATPGNGIWINAVHYYTTESDGVTQVENDPNDYYDFYIKACWLNADSTQDQYNLLVRVNDSQVLYSNQTISNEISVPMGGGGPMNAGNQGYFCTISVADKGSLYCWGNNLHGRIGNGDTNGDRDVLTPTKVVNANGFVNEGLLKVAGEYSVTCVIDSHHQLWCWGYNAEAEVGTGLTTPSEIHFPTKVTVLGDKYVKDVEMGQYHVCVVASTSASTSDDWAYCWGYNGYGQLGDGSYPTNQKLAVPVSHTNVPAGYIFKSIAAGMYSSCGIVGKVGDNSDDQAYCWGINTQGQLGIGGINSPVIIPTKIDTSGVLKNKTIKYIDTASATAASAYAHTCAIASDSHIYCWGNNDFGFLGDGTYTRKVSPVAVAGVLASANVTAMSTGFYNTCARSNGKAYCWGENGSGQLGVGAYGVSDCTTNGRNCDTVSGGRHILPTPVFTGSPSAIDSSTVMKSISTGETSTCAVDTLNNTYCWGYGGLGAIGNGSSQDALYPTKVTFPAF